MCVRAYVFTGPRGRGEGGPRRGRRGQRSPNAEEGQRGGTEATREQGTSLGRVLGLEDPFPSSHSPSALRDSWPGQSPPLPSPPWWLQKGMPVPGHVSLGPLKLSLYSNLCRGGGGLLSVPWGARSRRKSKQSRTSGPRTPSMVEQKQLTSKCQGDRSWEAREGSWAQARQEELGTARIWFWH